MPKVPMNYANTILYKIQHDTDLSLIYVGNTTSFRQRKCLHKRSCEIGDTSSKLYIMIRENGGWNAFRMTPIKEFPCKSYHDAIMEEDRIRLEWNIKPYKPRGLIHNTLDTSVDKTQIKDKINVNTLQDITLQNNTTQDDNTTQERTQDNTTHNTMVQDDNTMIQEDNTTHNTKMQDDNTTHNTKMQDDNTTQEQDNTTLQERTTHNTTQDNTTQDNTTHNTTIQDDNTQDDNTQDDKTQERIIIEPILKLRKLQVEISKEDELKRYYSRVLKKIKSLKSKHIFLKNKTLKHLIS